MQELANIKVSDWLLNIVGRSCDCILSCDVDRSNAFSSLNNHIASGPGKRVESGGESDPFKDYRLSRHPLAWLDFSHTRRGLAYSSAVEKAKSDKQSFKMQSGVCDAHWPNHYLVLLGAKVRDLRRLG